MSGGCATRNPPASCAESVPPSDAQSLITKEKKDDH
jgi:hypothetical protein